MNPILALDFVDSSRLPEFLVGFGFNAFTVAALATLTYRRSRSRAIYVFSIVMVNIVVFFVTYLMSEADIGVNVGFGLFALFGILRFRTGTLPVLEMTYLFAGIALAAFNALAPSALTIVELVITNITIVSMLEVLGGAWLSRQAESHSITYERVELVHPDRRSELIADLEGRTGLSIMGVIVHDINFLNDTARLTIRAKPTPEDSFIGHAEYENFEA